MEKLNYNLGEELIHEKCGGKIEVSTDYEGGYTIECEKCGHFC